MVERAGAVVDSVAVWWLGLSGWTVVSAATVCGAAVFGLVWLGEVWRRR